MTDQQNLSELGELKSLLEKNLALTQEIYKINQKIKKHLFWQKVTSLLYILIIILPLILGIIYLPKIMNTYLGGILPAGVNQQELFKDLLKNKDNFLNIK